MTRCIRFLFLLISFISLLASCGPNNNDPLARLSTDLAISQVSLEAMEDEASASPTKVRLNRLKVDFSQDRYCADYRYTDKLHLEVANKALYTLIRAADGHSILITEARKAFYLCDGEKISVVLELGEELTAGKYVLSFSGADDGKHKASQQRITVLIPEKQTPCARFVAYRFSSSLGDPACSAVVE